MKKTIKILSTTRIRHYGNISGPVKTPFEEDVVVIAQLLSAGVKISEVLADGTEVPLTLNNFDKDNSKKVKAPVKAYIPNPIEEARKKAASQQVVSNKQEAPKKTVQEDFAKGNNNQPNGKDTKKGIVDVIENV